MKHIFRLLIVIALMNVKSLSFSQSTTEWKSTLWLAIDKYYDSLKSKGIDTSIILSRDYDFFLPTDTLKGLEQVNIVETAVIVYFNNNKWGAVTFFYGILQNKNNGSVFQSQEITLAETDSLKQIKSLLPKIRDDDFEPFVFAYEKNNETVYRPFGRSHPSFDNITIHSKDYNIIKQIDEYDILEKPKHFENMPVNLNFKYNKSLSLYAFYQLLSRLSKQLEPLFVFRQSNL